MDEIFKQKLLSLRQGPGPKTFAEALLKDASWARAKAPQVAKVQPVNPENYSEKTQVLESLERFAQEKVEDQPVKTIKFDGGEIRVKDEPGWEGLSHFKDQAALISSLKLDPRVLEQNLASKRPGEVKLIFVTEKFRNYDEFSSELKSDFLDEVLAGFPLKTAELFKRMIEAMKLTPGEVIIYPVEGANEEDLASEVMEVASFMKPEMVVTLGAKATQKILKSNDRLSLVHGQFFTRKLGNEGSIHVVPLFHPSIIETNQNMKKTAWADMQKIMKHLKKLP